MPAKRTASPTAGPQPTAGQARRRSVGGLLLLMSAAVTCSFLVAPILGSTLDATNSFVSGLSAHGQPLSWLFRLSDAVAGATLFAGIWITRTEVPGTAWLRLAQWSAAVYAVLTAADSVLPMDCDPAADQYCRALEAAGQVSWQHEVHSVTGALESAAMTAAILGLALGTLRVRGWQSRAHTWLWLFAAQFAASAAITVQYLAMLPGLGISQRLAVLAWAASVGLAGHCLRRGAKEYWPQPRWPSHALSQGEGDDAVRSLLVPVPGQPGTRVQVEEHHPSAPATAVVMSGLGLPSELWHPVVQLLPSVRVILFDRPGLGGSDAWERLPVGLADQFAVLEAVLEATDCTGPVVLVGHSYGGLLAEAYTRQHPEKVAALVLVDPSDPAEEAAAAGPSARLTRAADRVLRSDRIALVMGRTVRRLSLEAGSSRPEAARPPRSPADAATARRQLRATVDELHAITGEAAHLQQIVEDDPRIGVPTRVLIGRWGGWPLHRVQHKWIATHLQRSELIGAQPIVRPGAHLLMMDDPHGVADSIRWGVRKRRTD